MNKLRNFVSKSFVGGVLVMSPLVILLMVFNWVFDTVTSLIEPLTQALLQYARMPELIADIIVVVLIALFCFVVGSIVSTSAGHWLHHHFDKYLVKLAPGYRMLKEIVNQFLGDKSSSPFASGKVALVYLYGRQLPTTATALVTSRHPDGRFTVFVPTGPNPTSGMIYHLPEDCVEMRPDINVDSMLRTVIACGAGSAELFHGINAGGPRAGETRAGG